MISEFQGSHRWLSNFWPCEIELDGKKYSSTEHAYQAAKFYDPKIREKIAKAPTPGKAKRLARDHAQRRMLTPPEKLDVMYKLLLQKFKQEPFRTKLINTGKQKIVEGNRWNDTFWGVCRGKGLNNLGILIMDIRNQLQHWSKKRKS